MTQEARAGALRALQCADPDTKTRLTRDLHAQVCDARVRVDPNAVLQPDDEALPGRPARPELLAPQHMPRRRNSNPAGRAAMLHAIAHIEFNAINLALDIVWRFGGLPEDFYRDWLRVAAEEAEHFLLVRDHLALQGYAYGDFPAHDGLWAMARKTADDLPARLALVPRTLEARGLDVNPAIRAGLAAAGDHDAARILDRILADEIGHVRLGNQWYAWACARADLDPLQAYDDLALRYGAPRQRGPFNVEARLQAGFSPAELERLQAAA